MSPDRRPGQDYQLQIAGARELFKRARVLFELNGVVSKDPRLIGACGLLGLPAPTTAEGIAEIRRIEQEKSLTATPKGHGTDEERWSRKERKRGRTSFYRWNR